jgi:hypothetical protein
MKGDFTRFTFDPRKRYTNVLKQQGRVDLDADWNEQSIIDSYLDRISRMDLSGVDSGAPSLDPGFAVTIQAGGGDLNISAGRFYAKGLICELFQDTTYLTQPFLPSPPPFPAVPAGGRIDSVYLDVWQRHITAVEAPFIKEIALGGPDTTTRLQTVFQVRINQNVGDVDCAHSPLPSPSGALMSSSLVPVPPEDDLCLIGATGGYRGLENRLYRVEIHTPGALGTATFKWSRDNGSVVFSISEFVAGQPTKIRITRLGRDQVLSLHEGDWVEVLDDNNELSGTPGTVAQIQNIDAANRELTLSVAVSGTMTAHPKVRRWDQKSAQITTSATPIPLEDGVQVSFGGSNFQTGDYWMFAARVVDGSIETLTNQPAQGIEHVYAQLAIVTWTTATTATVHDCRNIFPAPQGEECCCCSVSVGDGVKSKGDFTSIQEAIDALPDTNEFVEVCILAGRHVLERSVIVTRSNILIRGCGARSLIQGLNDKPVFLISKNQNVRLENLFINAAGPAPAIQVTAVRDIAISGCQLMLKVGFSLVLSALDCRVSDSAFHGGIQIQSGSGNVRISHNRIEKSVSPGISFGGGGGTADDYKLALFGPTGSYSVRSVSIRENYIVGNNYTGICTLFEGDNRSLGIDGLLIAGNLIHGNVAGRGERAIAVGGIVLQRASNIRIGHNEISNNGLKSSGACGIFLFECSNIDIEGNSILDNGNADEVIQSKCTNFQTMPPADGPNPRLEADVTFTLMDASGGVVPPSKIIKTSFGAGSFTGLMGTPNVSISLPSSDAVEVTVLLPKGASIELAAFNAGGTQVAGLKVVGTATAQPIPLTGAGITKVSLAAERYLLLDVCRTVVATASQPQGGILANIITTDHANEPAQAFPLGYPALRVHDNVVNTPAGHALLINAIGQVSVESNSLTSNGALKQPNLEFVVPFSVAVYDFGVSYAPSDFFFLLLLLREILKNGPTGFDGTDTLFDGRILFQGNQVAYRALNGTIEAGSVAFGIVGLDACQVPNNQFRAECGGRILGIDLVAAGSTVCVTGNAFSEIPNSALFSAYTAAGNVITSFNQSTHCLLIIGSKQEVDQPNQITISTLCPDVTPYMKALRG